jgi:hypothetical protein
MFYKFLPFIPLTSFPICFTPSLSFHRLDVEKVANDQANLESKELAALARSLVFVCFSIAMLVSAKVSKFLRAASCLGKACRTRRGWIMILVSSTMIIFVTLLSS